MSKRRVQEQFGANAAAYAISAVHARGSSLVRLVELCRPQPEWRVLDIATAAGHTAHSFAPHVQSVVATDITRAMLAVAARQGQNKGLANVILSAADAEALPFAGGSFELVTCRIAAHHFPHVAQFVSEAARVLRPDGLLAITDNIVPGSPLRGKKAQKIRDAGRYVNAFEKLRDPSHGRCLSLDEWRNLLAGAGFQLLHEESEGKAMDFDDWAARMQVPPADQVRLRVMLRQAPPAVADFLRPEFIGSRIRFSLIESIFLARKPLT